MSEERVRERLRDLRAPDEGEAEERGWRIVRAAFGERGKHPAKGRVLRTRTSLAFAALLILIAGAFTSPGEAVGDWLRNVVRQEHKPSKQALFSLPARGRLLVSSAEGPWIVQRDGSKRLLRSYEDASWSPRGLFVAATRDRELFALDPKGTVRWSIARPGLAREPRWSPSGFRIAYLSGPSLRVVAGDGSGDRRLRRKVARVAPAWRPGKRHLVAFADAAGRVHVVDVDSGDSLWRSDAGDAVSQLAWSSDARRLLVVSQTSVRMLDARGRSVASYAIPAGTRVERIAPVPSGRSFAIVLHDPAENRSEAVLGRLAKENGSDRSLGRVLFSGVGRFSDLTWSPDGRWLLLAWQGADQWLLIDTRAVGGSSVGKLIAVSNVSRQFNPGSEGRAAFPTLGGWCCPP